MKKSLLSRCVLGSTLLLGGIMLVPTAAHAQMVANADMLNFGTAFNLPQLKGYAGPRGDSSEQLRKAQKNAFVAVAQTASSQGVNILWPSESATFTFRVNNLSGKTLQLKGKLEVISFSTNVETGDVWVPRVIRNKLETSTPVEVKFDANGLGEIKVKPTIPARFGGYALVFDFGQYGRVWGAGVTRVVHADEGRVFSPGYALDMARGYEMTPLLPASFRKLGVKAARFEAGYVPTNAPDYKERMAQLDEHLRWAKENNVSVMLTLGAGGTQPLGRGRPWLDEKGVMREGFKEDLAWLPSQDADFQEWTKNLAIKYGYPNGAVNAVELWNEPWEGVSISGWGADGGRYREIYQHMANGILEARKASGVKVLIGGSSSSSNTLDKLFADGSNRFLPILDFASLHYQPMGVTPSLIPAWRNRKNVMGPVRVWDTESWVANSEDRIAAVVASMRAMGHDRAMGTFGGNVFTLQNYGSNAATSSVVQTWPPAAASGAVAKFIGERPFRGLVQKGLPWIFAFNGSPQKGMDDGTVVVVGDLSGVYDRNLMLFREVYGLKNKPLVAKLQAKLAALPANADPKVRTQLETDLKSKSVLQGGSLTLSDGKGRFHLLDFYGNRVPSKNGKITVPLNGLGYFLRADGSKGSFEALLAALKVARTEGYEPIEIVAHDFTAPIEQKPLLRLTLTNILNRPISGKLQLNLTGLQLENGAQNLTFAPNEVKTVYARVTGKARRDNRYPLKASFNAGTDGIADHSETLNVNYIARQTIQVDGKMNEKEWRGAIPQVLSAAGIARSQTESAWLPFKAFDSSTAAGQTTAYLAYDKNYFYFAAKTADKTPDPGNVRFATRDDDSYFYPPVSYQTGNVARGFSARWTGFIQAPQSGTYTFTTLTDDGVRLFIGDKKVVDNWTSHGPTENSGTVELKAGEKIPVRLEYFQGEGGAEMHLFWQGPDMSRQVVPTSALFTNQDATAGNGLSAEFFRDVEMTDSAVKRVDKQIDFSWQPNVYPDAAFNTEKAKLKPMVWPAGVRRFSYRRDPDLPAGNFPPHDNVQLAFNAIPLEKEPWLSHSPGTPPRWQVYPDTDYEYALNTVAPQYGGGTEVWRLQVPGMSRKHFYPRQPASKFDGPAKGAKMVSKREGNTRILEAAIPWSEMPDVQKLMLAKKPLKFTFRVNDNDGPSYELAQNRSVAKQNPLTFHVDWVTHWSNELEWGWGK